MSSLILMKVKPKVCCERVYVWAELDVAKLPPANVHYTYLWSFRLQCEDVAVRDLASLVFGCALKAVPQRLLPS